MEVVLANRNDVAIRKIDILNWKTDAAQQAAEDFGLNAVPYVRVYGPNAKFLGHVQGDNVKAIEKLLTKRRL